MKKQKAFVATGVFLVALFASTAASAQVVPQVVIETRFVRVPRAIADELFKKDDSNIEPFAGIDPQTLKRLQELQDQKAATVLAQPKLITTSGTMADVKATVEVEYPTEFEEKNGAIVPAKFNTRDVGTLLSAQPTVGEDIKTINLVVVCERSTVDPKGKKVQVVPKGVEKAITLELPQFSSQKATTTVTMWTGTTHLLGITEPLPEEKNGGDSVVLILLNAKITK